MTSPIAEILTCIADLNDDFDDHLIDKLDHLINEHAALINEHQLADAIYRSLPNDPDNMIYHALSAHCPDFTFNHLPNQISRLLGD